MSARKPTEPKPPAEPKQDGFYWVLVFGEWTVAHRRTVDTAHPNTVGFERLAPIWNHLGNEIDLTWAEMVVEALTGPLYPPPLPGRPIR